MKPKVNLFLTFACWVFPKVKEIYLQREVNQVTMMLKEIHQIEVHGTKSNIMSKHVYQYKTKHP
jgi:hypothetical protein